MKKKKLEITVKTGKKVLKGYLPETTIQPVNGRIIVFEEAVKEVELGSGIIAPGKFNNDPNKEQKILQNNRYFILAVAEDCPLMVADDGVVRPLQRGDELICSMNDEATFFSFPKITDYSHPDAPKYSSVHFTEVDGVFPTEKKMVDSDPEPKK